MRFLILSVMIIAVVIFRIVVNISFLGDLQLSKKLIMHPVLRATEKSTNALYTISIRLLFVFFFFNTS